MEPLESPAASKLSWISVFSAHTERWLNGRAGSTPSLPARSTTAAQDAFGPPSGFSRHCARLLLGGQSRESLLKPGSSPRFPASAADILQTCDTVLLLDITAAAALQGLKLVGQTPWVSSPQNGERFTVRFILEGISR